jgi:hypothetical protein
MPTNLIILFGPLAVGKMTVGQALSEKTGYKLFHNHVTIDPLTQIFDYGHPAMRVLIPEFRFRVMEEAMKHGLPGLIHTFVWAFQEGVGDTEFMGKLLARAQCYNARICFVELQAPQEARKLRAFSENRGKYKPGNVQRAEMLADFEEGHQLDSRGQFPFPDSYLRIDNGDVPPEEAAQRICDYFKLPGI